MAEHRIVMMERRKRLGNGVISGRRLAERYCSREARTSIANSCLAFRWGSREFVIMLLRFLLLAIGAFLFAACTDDGSPQPKMKQESHTSAMGQTTYTYRPAN